MAAPRGEFAGVYSTRRRCGRGGNAEKSRLDRSICGEEAEGALTLLARGSLVLAVFRTGLGIPVEWREGVCEGATWRPSKDYEAFAAAAFFAAQYRFEASMMRFLPAALSFRFGLGAAAAAAASGFDADLTAAHLFC